MTRQVLKWKNRNVTINYLNFILKLVLKLLFSPDVNELDLGGETDDNAYEGGDTLKPDSIAP